jgi:hypothetical protein
MSALNARRWRVRGQMVATGDSARRCARVDGVYSTTVRVDGVRAARLSHRCRRSRRVPQVSSFRSSVALRRRRAALRGSRAFSDASAVGMRSQPLGAGVVTFLLALCKHTSKQDSSRQNSCSGSYSCVFGASVQHSTAY